VASQAASSLLGHEPRGNCPANTESRNPNAHHARAKQRCKAPGQNCVLSSGNIQSSRTVNRWASYAEAVSFLVIRIRL
jgi:hypothetical protein